MLASIVAAVLLISTGALAAPQATSTASFAPNCKGTYGPFQLFAKVNSDVSYPIRLLVDETTKTNATSHMIIDTDDVRLISVEGVYLTLVNRLVQIVESDPVTGI